MIVEYIRQGPDILQSPILDIICCGSTMKALASDDDGRYFR